MPELPEVETIRRQLSRVLSGARIVRVVVRRADVIGYPAVGRFQRMLRGKVVRAVRRRGKYLVFVLSPAGKLIVHLRLSGHLRLLGGDAAAKHERVRFVFDRGGSLSFIEPRALGRVYFVEGKELPPALDGFRRLGREPIDRRFDPDYLSARFQGRRARVKDLLLDQRICAGVGNIYSDEALFFAGIRPLRRADRLKSEEISRLVRALKMVLRAGIKNLGTTMADGRYLQPDGARGRFGDKLMVYGRAGEPCRVCGAKVKRIKIGSRSSYFCPGCQS